MRGKEEAEGMHALAFRLPKPPKTQWSPLRQVCVCALSCWLDTVPLNCLSCWRWRRLYSLQDLFQTVYPTLSQPPSDNGWFQLSLTALRVGWAQQGDSHSRSLMGSKSLCGWGWLVSKVFITVCAACAETTAGAPQASFSGSMGSFHVLTPSWWFEDSSASCMMTQVPKYTCLMRDRQAGSCLWLSFC